HQIRKEFPETQQGGLTRTRFHDFIVLSRQNDAHDAADLRLIIDDKDLTCAQECCSPALAVGRVKKNSEPCPDRLSAQISPPCASTISRAMASPMPVPGMRPLPWT